MPRFSEYYQLNKSQQELDFIDIDTSEDIPVYIDPYAIEIHDDDRSTNSAEYIRTFFTELLEALRKKDFERARSLMGNLHEPRETFLGVSKGVPKGRGVGSGQASQLINAILKSKAYKTGLLTDLSEMALYVEGIDRDKISDLTTNIIREVLVNYTNEQCDLFSIPVKGYNGPPLWNQSRRNWQSKIVHLPFVDETPVLLVPKHIVRRQLSLDSQQFYNKQLTEFLQTEHLRANSSLVQTLKGGQKKVFKKDVKEKNPYSKDFIAEFISKNPKIFEIYKEIAQKSGAMSSFEDSDLSLPSVCGHLRSILKSIPTGKAHADDYHKFIIGALTALFYPTLIQPRKEWPINQGRKRIDIVYTNAAETGFFSHRRSDGRASANVVIIECKNYSTDLGNEETDQLLGRFDENKGRLGIITCRQLDNPTLLESRCRDAATRGQGYIIVLTDNDIDTMLEAKSQLQDDKIEEILHEKFRALIA